MNAHRLYALAKHIARFAWKLLEPFAMLVLLPILVPIIVLGWALGGVEDLWNDTRAKDMDQ